MKAFAYLVASSIAVSLVACGGDDKPSGSASCNVSSASFCMDITPPLAGDQATCQQQGGTWSTSPCPTANLVGTCNITSPNQTVAVRFYPPNDDPSASSTCTNLCTQIPNTGCSYAP